MPPPSQGWLPVISTVLDKTLQLFGRTFLIAVFIPTLVTAVVLNVVWHGYGQVSSTAERWSSGGVSAAALDIASWFLALYLVAYVIYGARSVLRTVFQGVWPGPLKPIQSVCEKLVVMRFRRACDRLDRLADRKNDVAWIVDDVKWCVRTPSDWNTDPPWTAPGSSPEELDPLLRRARRRLNAANRVLDRHSAPAWWRQRCVLHALVSGRAAVTWIGPRSQEQQTEINEVKACLQQLCVCATSCADRCARAERFMMAVQHAAAWIERQRGQAEVKRYADFPPSEDQVRATLFGNVMARLIAYPTTRYEIPLDTLWPRLTHVVPDPDLQRVDDASIFVDFSVVSGCGAAVVVIGCAMAAFLVDGSVLRALGFGIGGAVAFVVFNRVAITAARSFAEEIESCIDMYRLALLEKLGYRRPRDLAAERAIWNALYDLFSRGILPPKPNILQQSSARAESPKLAAGPIGRSPNPTPGRLRRSAARIPK
jgi:hypothetical protein